MQKLIKLAELFKLNKKYLKIRKYPKLLCQKNMFYKNCWKFNNL